MGAFVTTQSYADAVGISYATACRRLTGTETDTIGRRRFDIADVIPTIRPSERHSVSRLLAVADRQDCFFVGNEVAKRARKIENWLLPTGRARLEIQRLWLAPALASFSADMFLFYERLRLALLLHNDVLWHALGETPPPNDFNYLAFAIANAKEENLEIELA